MDETRPGQWRPEQEEGVSAQHGTQGYRSGTEGYRAEPETQDDEGFWRRYGFESFQQYMEHLEEVQGPMWGPRRARLRDLDDPSPALPDSSKPRRALRPVATVDRRGRYRQLGVKLAHSDFELLQSLADSHSVSPTTMARMLVVRGVRAGSQGAGAVSPSATELR